MSQTLSNVASFLKLRGKTIVTVLALLVIAATIPFAIVDTFEKGRIYLPVLIAIPGGVTTTVLRIWTFAIHFTTAARYFARGAWRHD